MVQEISFSKDANNEAAGASSKFLDEVTAAVQGEAKPVSLADAAQTSGDAAQGAVDNASEATEKIKFKSEQKWEKELPPLTRTESLMLRSLTTALHDANPETIQELLGALSEHPNSVRRVLGELKKVIEQSDEAGTLRVNWEQGTDSNNQSFVRLRLSKPDSADSRLNVVIGSDGQHQSFRHTKNTNQTELVPLEQGMQGVRPEQGRRQVSVKKELLKQAIERRQNT